MLLAEHCKGYREDHHLHEHHEIMVTEEVYEILTNTRLKV